MAGSGNAGNDRADERDGIDRIKERLIWSLLAIIAGGSGAFGYMNVNPPRPDPWTGAQAREAHEKLERRLDAIDQRDEVLRNRLEAHLVRGEAGFWRIEQLERQVKELKERK